MVVLLMEVEDRSKLMSSILGILGREEPIRKLIFKMIEINFIMHLVVVTLKNTEKILQEHHWALITKPCPVNTPTLTKMACVCSKATAKNHKHKSPAQSSNRT
jgi:hypothetical protein